MNSGYSAYLLEALLNTSHECIGFGCLADDLADCAGQFLPGNAIIDISVRLGDSRRDLGQQVIVFLGDTGVQRQDQVGLERSDLFKVDRRGIPRTSGMASPSFSWAQAR